MDKAELTRKTLEAVKHFLIVRHADWKEIGLKTGMPPFDDEDVAILYGACCTALEDDSTPDLSGVKVNVGGTLIDAQALLMLGSALKGD